MKKLLAVALCFFSTHAISLELEENEIYRSKVELRVSDHKESDSIAGVVSVGADSKFEVLDVLDNGQYLIHFTKIYGGEREENSVEPGSKVEKVVEGKMYYLDGKIYDTPLEKLVVKNFSGVSSGPLIVPFKYRIGDKSFSGEATVGYYAGLGVDLFNTGVSIVPFLSAGLTQVSTTTQTADGIVTENRSGVTWATGLLLQNWDKVNIGLIYGQDRIGESDWKHEGEGWLSVFVGWKI